MLSLKIRANLFFWNKVIVKYSDKTGKEIMIIKYKILIEW